MSTSSTNFAKPSILRISVNNLGGMIALHGSNFLMNADTFSTSFAACEFGLMVADFSFSSPSLVNSFVLTSLLGDKASAFSLTLAVGGSGFAPNLASIAGAGDSGVADSSRSPAISVSMPDGVQKFSNL